MSLATAGICCTIIPPLSGAMEDCFIVRVQQLRNANALSPKMLYVRLTMHDCLIILPFRLVLILGLEADPEGGAGELMKNLRKRMIMHWVNDSHLTTLVLESAIENKLADCCFSFASDDGII